jgi:hypothetical protein
VGCIHQRREQSRIPRDPITVGGVANLNSLSVFDVVYTTVRGTPFCGSGDVREQGDTMNGFDRQGEGAADSENIEKSRHLASLRESGLYCASRESRNVSADGGYFSFIILADAHFPHDTAHKICLRSSIRALRSSWRTWLCATKSACFSDP